MWFGILTSCLCKSCYYKHHFLTIHVKPACHNFLYLYIRYICLCILWLCLCSFLFFYMLCIKYVYICKFGVFCLSLVELRVSAHGHVLFAALTDVHVCENTRERKTINFSTIYRTDGKLLIFMARFSVAFLAIFFYLYTPSSLILSCQIFTQSSQFSYFLIFVTVIR